MPKGIGKLRSLQTLTMFVVGQKNSGYGIRELELRNLLGGKLEIHDLEYVENKNDAEGANLKLKPNLYRLELNWSKDCDKDGKDLLEGLQPHINVKILSVKYYRGVSFPKWMMRSSSLPNMVEISLRHCNKCEHLPALGQLPSLKVLKVLEMKAVKALGREFYTDGTLSGAERVTPAFPSLRIFILVNLPNLEKWLEPESVSFSCLENLSIENCPKLTSLPTEFPSLQEIRLLNINSLIVEKLAERTLTSLTYLLIGGCPELKYLPRRLLQNNKVLRKLQVRKFPKFQAFRSNNEDPEPVSTSSLESLEIVGCPLLSDFPDIRGLNSLRSLAISDCENWDSLTVELQCSCTLEELIIGGFSEKLRSFPFPDVRQLVFLQRLLIKGWSMQTVIPEQLEHFTKLKELTISDFPDLVSLPNSLGNLESLQILEIKSCKVLMSLPSKEIMSRLRALKKLRIIDCPRLKDRCSKNTGDEWYKVAHILDLLYD
ncbi:hypothetical protein GIB67_042969 [Kingdonia uniflora]|uniref:Uncharacterized protein n=1 Tax=Kingdonia uniflora TaxID=39325 RepID=A0A7J7L670_9MAGN|nr:hypothetical protein GIB67_042969 [Kingdonia uniflora]